MHTPPVVSQDEWYRTRQLLQRDEEELTRARDALAAKRRRHPWLHIEKEYLFEGPEGTKTLHDLFDGRRQLITYRFFFEQGVEGWPEAGCVGCSLFVDSVGHLAHLHARDTTFVLISPAPQSNITAYKYRMGWEIPWFTAPADFAGDFDATEWFALNVFIQTNDEVYRTYFMNGREVEVMGNAWSLLDLTPFGRQESWEDSPDGYPQSDDYLWRRHDEYR